jgi:hypothetical protein
MQADIKAADDFDHPQPCMILGPASKKEMQSR